MLPAETLIFDQSGTHVAVVGEGGKVRMVAVDIRRDFGTSLEVDEGPKGGDEVVLSPPAALKDGTAVKVEDEEKGDALPKPTGTPAMSGSPPAPVPGGEGAGGVGAMSDQ